MQAHDDRLRPPRAEEARELGRALSAPVIWASAALAAGVPAARGNETRLRHVADALARRMEALGLPDEVRVQATRDLAPFFEDTTPPPPGIAGRVAFAGNGQRVFGLSFPVEPGGFVAGCAPVRVLLRAAQEGRPYRVLALSTNQVRVARGDVRGLAPEPRAELPDGLVDALGRQIEPEGLQLHGGAAGGRRAIFHGHGGSDAERELDRERFHRVLRDALLRAFGGSELPIVLVTDRTHRALGDELQPRLPLVGLVEGSPDRWSPNGLHTRAWPLVEAAARREQAERRVELERARTRGEAALGLQRCIEAVAQGSARRLWLPSGPSVHGAVDVRFQRAVPAFGDEDLLDALACAALRCGADVETLAPEESLFADAEVAVELHAARRKP